ncbi:hypothetical protein BB560_001815 [Smittium megazygosporum]|uniref:RING-type domain-containing protein n=1 Tax=Smittium megazygosporum TaxID=133381 RepID=A0A2T9ZGH0_9FUNG|nr:hypothetical protein BB560_001815 [Smittium megazygosporum]
MGQINSTQNPPEAPQDILDTLTSNNNEELSRNSPNFHNENFNTTQFHNLQTSLSGGPDTLEATPQTTELGDGLQFSSSTLPSTETSPINFDQNVTIRKRKRKTISTISSSYAESQSDLTPSCSHSSLPLEEGPNPSHLSPNEPIESPLEHNQPNSDTNTSEQPLLSESQPEVDSPANAQDPPQSQNQSQIEPEQNSPHASENENVNTSTSQNNSSSNNTNTHNSVLAAAVARSVISATRYEFSRPPPLQNGQSEHLSVFPSTNDNSRQRDRSWPPLQESAARVLENGIQSFILEVLNSSQSTSNNESTTENSEPRSLASSNLASTNTDAAQIPTPDTQDSAPSNDASAPNNHSHEQEDNDDNILLNNNNNSYGLGYMDTPGGYRFRVFPILSSSFPSENSEGETPQSDTSPTDQSTTLTDDSTHELPPQHINLSLEESVNEMNISQNGSSEQPANATHNSSSTESQSSNSDSSSEQELLRNQREVLRRMLHSQNARQQQIPVIIVGVESRFSEDSFFSNASGTTPASSNSISSDNQPRTHSRVRSILSSIYNRVSRLMPLGSSSARPNSPLDTQVPQTTSTSGLSSLFGDHGSANHEQQSNLDDSPSLESTRNTLNDQSSSPLNALPNPPLGSNGFVVYVFATSFELSHPLLLSFLIGSLFPSLMDSNNDLVLNETANGQLYEDFMALSELLGQAISPVATIADVESQLPKYIFSHEPAKYINNLEQQVAQTPEPTSADDHNLSLNQKNSFDSANSQSATAYSKTESLYNSFESLQETLAAQQNIDIDPNSPSQTEPSFVAPEELIGVGRLVDDPKVSVLLLSAEKCLVCMEEFGTGDLLRVLKCRHGFHTDCIANWITKGANRCPVCRAEAVHSSLRP